MRVVDKLFTVANKAAGRFELEIRPTGFKVDFDEESIAILRRVQPYTMTTPERIFALIEAVRYITKAGVPGSIVECGVWRGGSMMAAALTLMQSSTRDVDLYLFDTYEGMPPPDVVDVDSRGRAASDQLAASRRSESSMIWAYSPLDEVRRNMEETGYDPAKIHFVKGKVEDTIPGQSPAEIAILRLDTDWYSSTRHELVHLYPRLSRGGVLIMDDYGWWKGARQAYDEYASENGIHLLLSRIDETGRIAVKT